VNEPGTVNALSAEERIIKGISAALRGVIVNSVLAVIKILTGVIGHSYALIADGIESAADIFSSLIVLHGLRVSSRGSDESFHFGYGKAESLSALFVGLMLLGSALGICIAGIREILSPHLPPEPYTLLVLIGVVAVKERLYRNVINVGNEVESQAVRGDAWHHRADALSSLAAALGISVALVGGKGWEAADDYAAVFCAVVIGLTGRKLLIEALGDLMDRAPEQPVLEQIMQTSSSVAGVCFVEKMLARKSGVGYLVDLHVQADSRMSLHDAHDLSHKVKSAVMQAIPAVLEMTIHMEPHEPGQQPAD
jgi:cation diffusion facilitator family transporter